MSAPASNPSVKRAPLKLAELQKRLALIGQQAQMGLLDAAVAQCQDILSHNPGHVQTLHTLGSLAVRQGQMQAAQQAFEAALRVDPRHLPSLADLAGALNQMGQHAAATACFRKALSQQAHNPGLLNGLGLSLCAQGQFEEGLRCFDQALRHAPKEPILLTNRANALAELGHQCRRMGRLHEALQHYQQATVAQPQWVNAWSNLGLIRQELGDHEPSLRASRHALSLAPDDLALHSAALFALASLGLGHTADYRQQAQAFAQATRRHLARHPEPTQAHPAAPQPGERALKVGLVSGDLCDHPVGYFLEHLLNHLDPRSVEVQVFSNFERHDAVSARLRARVKGWHAIEPLTDAQAATLVRAQGIDVLVDLSGHTARNRLGLFARRPAAHQVSWLGYFASTGLPEMDTCLVDPWCAPAQEAEAFTESLHRLPHTRLCFTPPDAAPDVSPCPALAHGHLTFGSFQHPGKLTGDTLSHWGLVMQALPQARLRLQNRSLNDAPAREALLARLAQHGLDTSRVSLHGGTDRQAYLAAHSQVDILLDTSPYPGGTTTCEALWMGVPTLSLRGHNLLGRQGECLLTNAGLPDWVAQDAQAMVALACHHAARMDALNQLRQALRARVAASPLMDGARFAQAWTQALWNCATHSTTRASITHSTTLDKA